MKWWKYCFDKSWVVCRNVLCRTEFMHTQIQNKRKCPKCKMNNKLQLPKKEQE